MVTKVSETIVGKQRRIEPAKYPASVEHGLENMLRALKSGRKRIASGLLRIESADVRAHYTNLIRATKELSKRVKSVDYKSVISIDQIQRVTAALENINLEEEGNNSELLSKLLQELKDFIEPTSPDRTAQKKRSNYSTGSMPMLPAREAFLYHSPPDSLVSMSPSESENTRAPPRHVLELGDFRRDQEPAVDPALVLWLDAKRIVRQSHNPSVTSGGFCDVFIGEHQTYGKVALKRPRIIGNAATATQIRRFKKEAQLWKGLDHPNVLRFVGTVESEGCIWLVSLYAPNGTLTEYIQCHPDIKRRPLVMGLANGVSYLHGKGIIHGDIKGNNVLIHKDLRVMLCDFGLSKLHGEGWQTSVSLQGVGTVRWQAPELLSDSDTINPKSFKSDVYAFGITIFEILTGEKPFGDRSDLATAMAILKGQRPPTQPDSRSGESYKGFWEVAVRCWHHDPSQRPFMDAVCSSFGLLEYFGCLTVSGNPVRADN